METTLNYGDNRPEYSSQFQIVYWILLFSAILGIVFGLGIIISNVGILIFGIVDPPEFIVASGLQALISLVMGYITYRISIAVKKTEMWAFANSMYVNILVIVVYMSLGLIGLALAALPLLSLILIFVFQDVKNYWFPNFREDMGPRMKETRYSLYLLRRSPLVVGGVVVLSIFIILAIFAPYIAPYGPETRIWADSNLPPGSPSNNPALPAHYWGTDDSGGDIFSRILYGAQIDLRISLVVVLVAVTVGTLIGAVAGYYGGKIDELVMRVTDVFFAFPGLVLAMAIVMALGERSMDNISIALMITWWPAYARLVRGQVLAEREKLYVEAARSVGASDSRILISHVIPNTIQPIIVQATMDTGSVLLVAAGLAFIGFGPPAGIAEWGYMISIAQGYFMIAPWAVFFPGIAILLVALAFNLVGDGIRDIMDPKLRRR